MSLVKLQIQTSKNYLYQLKDNIYWSTGVAEVAAGAAALFPSHAVLPCCLSCGPAADVTGTVLMLKTLQGWGEDVLLTAPGGSISL